MTIKTIGILGGGQLGMYSAKAAKSLGFSAIIYSDKDNPCAAQTADSVIVAPYDDRDALEQFASQCDIITYEFENIPITTITQLQVYKPVYPEPNLLEIAQDRVAEKTFLNRIGIPTAPWQDITSISDIKNAWEAKKTSTLIIKTTRFGYDGKGQAKMDHADQADAIWHDLTQGKNDTLIAEGCIDFEHEISVIVARDSKGDMVTYGPMRNVHKNHILHETFYPSGLEQTLCNQAIKMGETLAEHVNLRGVLCLELFVIKDGALLANEIAPRTHNSGHWTLDACEHSQFDNHIRSISGLAVAAPNPRPARMLNLIGDDVLTADQHANGIVHNYGKGEIKEGRKMGHVNFLE